MKRFNWGLGQTADEDQPIEDNPGFEQESGEGGGTNATTGPGDQGPAVNLTLNPNAPVTAGAQSSTAPVQPLPSPTPSTPSTPSAPSPSTPTPAAPTDWTPYLIGGAVLAGAGGLLIWYARSKKR